MKPKPHITGYVRREDMDKHIKIILEVLLRKIAELSNLIAKLERSHD